MGLFSPWLRRDYEEKEFSLPLEYLIRHLDRHDRDKVVGKGRFNLPEDWQEKKVAKVLELMERGKRLAPIRVALHYKKDEFRVEDGVSRIIASSRKDKRRIHALVKVVEW